MSGVKLAIRYGYVPCKLGLCGPKDKERKKIINRFLNGEKKLKGRIKKILKEFKGAYPYYQLIARSNKITDSLNQKVVEAYWLGNPLLDKVKVSDFKKMMAKEFLPLGKVPEARIKKLPKKAISLHNFHVLAIGSVTGRFQETKKGLDFCRISWGKINNIFPNKIEVIRQPLQFSKKIILGKAEKKIISWNRNILPEIKKGDWVSIHWNTAIEILNKEKLKNIIKYNQKTLVAINKK
ncbi:MAG: DUF6390 family protein [Candidatus Moranbacteria bacterium]|nr:DUF6390 family protein [Candidatus Moranbacteria bacterium]